MNIRSNRWFIASPAYFGMNVAMNKQGYDFETVLNNGMRAVDKDFEAVVEETGANLRHRKKWRIRRRIYSTIHKHRN
jgi:hypothetical protein